MEQMVNVMMNLIKSEITGAEIDGAAVCALSPEEQTQMASLARKHSVAQLLADALGNCPETQNLPITEDLFPDLLAALNQVEKIEYEKNCACQVLNEAGIAYIPLKGARIRPYYPESWMRTSGDNDILVHEEEVDRAAELLVQKLNYRIEARNYHDISMFSEDSTELELHFSIKENMENLDRVLEQVWDYSQPKSDCEYQQSNEFFIFHLIAHMAYHFMTGGCGIRTYMDLFLLQDQLAYRDDEVIQLCRDAGIEKFYETSKQLIDVWFRNQAHSPTTRRMEAYILSGGTFGDAENRTAVAQKQTHSKYGIAYRRIFATMDHLCGRYPYLKTHKWLMPFYQVRRWISALHRGRLEILKEEWNTSQSLEYTFTSEIDQMLTENDML